MKNTLLSLFICLLSSGLAFAQAPVISLYGPANGATNVATSSDLTFVFSKKVQKGSGNIVIRNGSAIIETIAVTSPAVSISNDSLIRINPVNDFPSSANIAVSLENGTFEDLSGEKFTGNASLPWTFRVADVIVPTLIANSYSPANGATNVASTTNLTFRFSEKIRKGNGNIIIKNGNPTLETIAVTSNRVVITNDSVITIDPVNAFPSSANISISIHTNTFEDLSGNRFEGNDSSPWTFRALDATPPTVNTYAPTNGSTNVLVSQNLVLTFDEPMQKGTAGKVIFYDGADKLDSLDITSANITINANQVTINPVQDLPAGKTISVQITAGALESTTAVAFPGILSNTTWSFTTDGTAPTVSLFTPAPGTANVPVNDSLQLSFSEKIKKGTGSIVIRNGSTVLETIAINSSLVRIVGDSTQVIIKPVNNFPSATTITVDIGNGVFRDLSNNPYAGTTTEWNFTTKDTTPPNWLSFVPANGATNVRRTDNLIVRFSEKVKRGSAGTITIQNNGLDIETISVATAAAGVISIADSIVTINPANNLPSAGNISVVLSADAFEDLAGNSYGGNIPAHPWTFKVEDITPLIVATSYSPANGAANVSTTSDLTFVFSKKVQKGSGNIVIRNGSAIIETIAVTSPAVSISNDSLIRINPVNDFPSSANIAVSLENGTFEDLSGEKFTGNASLPWTFRVADVVPPTLIANSYIPANGATNVSATANISLRFSEKIRKGSGNIIIRNGAAVLETIAVGNARVTITNDSLVTINPANDFPSSANISVTINANTFEDFGGNSFAGNSTSPLSFQVADIIPPTLVANSYVPATGSTNVLANVDLTFRLSEKVQKGSGNIVIRNGSVIIETIAVTSPAVSISNDSLIRINPVNDFPSSANIAVSLENGTFEDLSGNKFAGNTSTSWTFKVVDFLSPTVNAYNPTDEATGVLPGAKLQLIFSEKVKKGANGTITIDKGAISQGIPINSSAISVADSIVTITPPTGLPVNSYISIQVTSGAFLDLANNPYAGIADTTTWNFRTVTDNNAPTYTDLQPKDNATQVAADAKLVITFSEKVVKQPGGAILLISSTGATQNIPVSGSNVVISGPNSDIVTITPPQTFPSGADMYVLVLPNSFADEAGNGFAGITDASNWNFKVIDNVPPTVGSKTPDNGTTGVSAYTNLVVTFSEAIKAGTGNITISQGAGNPTLTINITDGQRVIFNGNTLAISLPSPLVSGARVSVQTPGSAIADLAGNAFSGIAANTWTFTVADTQAPVVANNGLDPADNATNVNRTKVLRITFNENVKKGNGSILISENGTISTLAVSNANVAVNNNVVSINYAAIKSGGFASGADVFVLIPYGAFADSTGNFFQGIANPTDWNFTVADDSKPTVTQTSPANGTNNPSTTNLVVTFSEAIKAGTGANNRIRIYQVGETNPLETIAANNTGKVLITDKTVTIQNNPLPTSGVEIYITIDAGAFVDNSGNAFDGYITETQWRFKVADTRKPAIAALSPTNGKTSVKVNEPLIITFDETIRKGSVGKVLIFSDKVAPQTIELNQISVPVNSKMATIAHADFESNDNVYILIFPGTFTDVAGNSFDGITDDQTWRFSTADITAPQVSTLAPDKGSSGVALGTTLTIAFNEEIQKTGNGTIRIYRANTDALLQTIDVADTLVKLISKQSVQIKLKSNLPTATTVYVQIDSAAFADVDGNRFKGFYGKTDWSFTTVDLNAPRISTYLPDLEATNQPTNTNLTFTFDKDIQKGTGNIRLKVTGITNEVVIAVTDAAVAIRNDRRTVDVILSSYFPNGIPSGATVSITMDNGTFTDLANGNKFAGISTSNAWTFTVNDVVPPELVMETVTPADNSTNISVNTILRLTFSESVKAGTGKLSIYQVGNATPVATLNATQGSGLPGKTITYTLAQALPSEANLYILIDNKAFADLANLPFAGISNPDTWNFRTADINAPLVQTYSPQPKRTDVPVSQALVLTFSEEVKKGADGSITVNNGGEVQQININDATFDRVNKTVTFNRNFQFKSGKQVYVLIPAGLITDVAGNAFAGISNETVWTFTAIDNEPPKVAQLSPTIDATGVQPNAKLSITFSEGIKQGSGTIFISQQGSITLPDPTVTITNNGKTVNIPSSDFAAGKVTVIVPAGAFTDSTGNASPAINNWSFTVADVDAPKVTATTPISGASAVNPNVTILVTFSEVIRKKAGTITITPQGGTAQRIDVTSSRVSLLGQANNATSISIQLVESLPSGSLVTVSIPAGTFVDVENNPSVAHLWSFRVADVLPPTISNLSPKDDTTQVGRTSALVITFSEPVVRGTGDVTIYINDVLTYTLPVQRLVPAANSVTIVADDSWPSNARVEVRMPEGIFKDASGNPFAGIKATEWNFTIEDYIFPTITDFSPQNPPDAPISANITLTFSEPVKTGTGSIILKPSVGAQQTIAVTDVGKVRIVGNVVTINPSDFSSNALVEVTIPAGAFADLAGNAIQAEKKWSFNVVDTEIPSVFPFSPLDDSTNVPVDKKLQMVFNKEIKKNTGTISIVVNGKTYPIAVTSAAVTISSDRKVVTIDPFSTDLPSFPSEAAVYVTMPSGVFVDLSSSANRYPGISSPNTWNFTIADIIAPDVQTYDPGIQAVNVPVDKEIVLTMKESVRIRTQTDTITISQSTGAVEKIAVTDARVRLTNNGKEIRISHTKPFDSEATVTVRIPATAFEDFSRNQLVRTISWTFKAIDNIRPEVSRTSPVTNQTRVATTSPLIIVFKERVTKLTGSIVLTEANSQGGSGTQTLSVTSDSVRIVTINENGKDVSQVTILHKPFISGATVSVLMFDNVFADLAGNTFAGFVDANSWKFVVSDISLPEIANTSPIDDATKVSPTTDLIINFTEPMKRGTGSINLIFSSTLPINVSEKSQVIMEDGATSVTIRPGFPLPSNERITVNITKGAFTDLEGNPFELTDNAKWNFTIADVVNPELAVNGYDPAPGSSNVPQDKILGLTFKKPVVPGSGFIRIFQQNNSTPLVSIDVNDANKVKIDNANNRIIRITPGTSLPSGVSLYVTVDAGGFVDLSGNDFLGVGVNVWNFTVQDVTPPRITNTTPANNVQNVDPSTPLIATFSEVVKAVADKRIYVVVNGVVRDSILATATQLANTNDITRVTIPVRSFNSEDKVYIRIPAGAFVDVVGNPFAGYSTAADWNFTIADVTAPTASNFTPKDKSTYIKVDTILTLTFNEPIRKGAGFFILINEVNTTTGNNTRSISVEDPAITILPNQRTVQIVPPGGLPYRSKILIQIPKGAFTDYANNAFAGVGIDTTTPQWSFTTVPPPDFDPPKVQAFSPLDEAVDVPVTSELAITFNEPVFVGTGTITLSYASTDRPDNIQTFATIPINDAEKVRFQNNSTTGAYTVKFKSTGNLPANSNVSVQITNGAIVDSVGNKYAGIANISDWNFLTSDPSDTVAPLVQVFDPLDGASNVAVSKNFRLVFNEPMRLGKGNIIIDDNGEKRIIPINSTQVSLSGTVLTINPDKDLAPGANVNIQIPAEALTDRAGNRFQQENGKQGIPDPQDWNFSTANHPVLDPLQLESRTPEQGTIVKANTSQVMLKFNRKMKIYEGNILVKQNNAVTTLNALSSAVSIDPTDSSKIHIDFPSGFQAGATISIVIPTSVFVDIYDNSFEGFPESSPWQFTIEDKEPPVVTNYYPKQGATGVYKNTNLILEFSEPIKIVKGDVNISIVGAGNAKNIPLSSSEVRVYNNILEVNPGIDLAYVPDEWVSIQVAPGGLADLSNNAFGGITDDITWRFKVGNFIDNTAPQLQVDAYDPAPNKKGVDNEATLRIKFDEAIQKGKGAVKLVIDDITTTIDVTNSQISINDKEFIIKPTSPFPYLARVYVLIDSSAITDLANNKFKGIYNSSEWSFTIEQEAPVSLTLPTPAELEVADTLPLQDLTATLSERRPGVTAKFYYRGITTPDDTTWQVQSLALKGLSYTATLSREQIASDPIGIEYYYQLEFDSTINTNPVRYSTQYLYRYHTGHGQFIAGLKAGSEVSNYYILSVPLELQKSDVSLVFGDDLQIYDIKKWRIFHFDEDKQENVEYQSGLANIEPGKGYWFITRNQKALDTLDTGEGSAVKRNRTNPFSVFLTKGWNQIGNPYNFNVSWDDVVAANPGLDSVVLQTYEGQYRYATALPKFRGGFVFVNNDIRIQIPTTQRKTLNGGRTSDEKTIFNEGSLWEINFGLQAKETSYNLAGLGMHTFAQTSKDRYDQIALPRLPQHLDIRFEHPEYFAKYFAKDMVPVQDNYTWEFTASSGFDAQNVTLNWMTKLPEVSGKQWILFDVQQNRAIDLTLQTEYKFWLDKSNLFRLYYGSPEYIQEHMKPEFGSLGQIYPNPFHESTTIPFALAKSEQSYQVKVDIYTLTGVKIATLAEGTFGDGLHEVTWNGRAFDGSRVAAGLYVCELQVTGASGRATYRKKVIVQ